MKRVFVCSPYNGDIEKNTANARDICKLAVERGCAPFAPHLIYPQFLDENDERQRAQAIRLGLRFLECCDEIWVDVSKPTSIGMVEEIRTARRCGIPMIAVRDGVLVESDTNLDLIGANDRFGFLCKTAAMTPDVLERAGREVTE